MNLLTTKAMGRSLGRWLEGISFREGFMLMKVSITVSIHLLISINPTIK